MCVGGCPPWRDASPLSPAKHIVKVDGRAGLFKGLTPRLCSSAIGTVVHGKVLQVPGGTRGGHTYAGRGALPAGAGDAQTLRLTASVLAGPPPSPAAALTLPFPLQRYQEAEQAEVGVRPLSPANPPSLLPLFLPLSSLALLLPLSSPPMCPRSCGQRQPAIECCPQAEMQGWGAAEPALGGTTGPFRGGGEGAVPFLGVCSPSDASFLL